MLECTQIIKAGFIICDAVALHDAFEVKSRVCKPCIENLAPLTAPLAHLNEAFSPIETVAPLALVALAEASAEVLSKENANEGSQTTHSLTTASHADPLYDLDPLVSKFMTNMNLPNV